MSTASAFRASRAIVAMFFSLLSGVWLILWSNRSFGLLHVILAVIILGDLTLFGYAWNVFQQNKEAFTEDANTPEKKHADNIFKMVNAGRWILILVIGNVLVNLHRLQRILPSAMFIIGLHFIPLSNVFHYRPHYIMGSALMIWAIGYSFGTSMGPSNTVGCLVAGMIHWLSAIYGLTVMPVHSEFPIDK